MRALKTLEWIARQPRPLREVRPRQLSELSRLGWVLIEGGQVSATELGVMELITSTAVDRNHGPRPASAARA